MIYRKYKFNLDGIKEINKSKYREKMPVVYLIYNDKNIYIGQTVKFEKRMKDHIIDLNRYGLREILMISDKTFNESVIKDIEAQLIRCIPCDGKLKLINRKEETEDNYYYKKEEYEFVIDTIWEKLYMMGLVNHNMRKIRNMYTFKLSPYTALSMEQYNIANTIINKDIKTNNNISVYGRGGTGKTLLAIHIFKKLIDKNSNLKIKLVEPTRTFRFSVRKSFDKTEGLEKDMVIAPNQLGKGEKFDILIVDEAHRLRRCKNLSSGNEYKKFKRISEELGLDYKKTNELEWIEKCSDKQIIFYDYNQRIKPSDIRKEDLEKYVEKSKKYRLVSQLRCQGGNDYISFVLDLLNCTLKQNSIKKFGNYEIKVFDDAQEMKKEIAKKERQYGSCRRVSGICFKWDKKNKSTFAVDNTREKWNTNIEDWVNSKNAFKELGCIHTIQGYDLNYCSVVFGKEIDYDEKNNELIINKENYLDLNGKKSEIDEEIKKYIKDTYYTMLTRGIKGTYIYAMNDSLREYLKRHIEVFKK